MNNKKTYVLDTTVMIYDPEIFYKLGNADIVLPIAAIKELDGLKKSNSDLVSKSAREVSRFLDRLSSYSDLTEEGGKVSSGGRVFIEKNYEKVEGLDSEVDCKIVGTALYLKNKGVKNLILSTTDTNMRVVGRSYGIRVEQIPYEASTENRKESAVMLKKQTKKSNKLMRYIKAFNYAFLPRKVKRVIFIYLSLVIALYLLMPKKNFWLAAFIIAILMIFVYLIISSEKREYILFRDIPFMVTILMDDDDKHKH